MIANDYSVLKPVPTYQTTALAPAMGGVTSFVQPRTIGTTLNGVNPMAGTLTGGTSGLPVFSNTVAGFANNTMSTGSTVRSSMLIARRRPQLPLYLYNKTQGILTAFLLSILVWD